MLLKAMGKPFHAPGFKALYLEWNQKLTESGFEDIEELRNGKFCLKKSGTAGRFEQTSELVRDAKTTYFSIIGQKIAETHFDDEQERQILTLYFEGHSQAQIRRKLDPQLHRSTIYKKLYKWLKIWKLK